MKKSKWISIIMIASCNLYLSGCINTDAETIYSRIFHSGILTQGPEKKVEELFKLIEEGEISKAKNIYNEAESALKEKHSQIKEKGGIQYFETSRDCSNGELVEIDYVLKYNDGSEEQESMTLIRKDGEWRVLDTPGIPCF